MKLRGYILALTGLLSLLNSTFAFQQPAAPRLPNFDNRIIPPVQQSTPSNDKADALTELQKRLPNLRVDFDPVTRAPKVILNRDGFLAGVNGSGGGVSATSLANLPATDPHRITKAFLQEHSKLFGHG